MTQIITPQFLDGLPVAALIVEDEAVRFNKATEKLIGYCNDEIPTLAEWFARLFPQNGEEERTRFETDRAAGFPGRRELTVTRKDGTRRNIEFAASQGDSLMCILHDVTGRKRLENSLKESQSLLHNLSALVPGVLFQVYLSVEGEFTAPYASTKSHDIYELAPEEIQADLSVVFERIHPDDRKGFFSTIEESATSLQPWEYEYRVVLPRQGVKWVVGSAQPRKLPDGRIVWYGIVLDITQRKHAELEQSRKDFLMQSLIDNCIDPLFLNDSDGRYLLANTAALALYGKTAEEVTGKTVAEICSDREIVTTIQCHDRMAMESKQGIVVEETIQTGSGPRMYQVSKAPCRDGNGHVIGLVSNSRDITEAKLAEQEILSYQEKLRSLSAEMSEVEEQERKRIASLLHDEVGQVLAMIKINIEDMISRERSAKRRRQMQDVVSQIRHAIGFTRSLTAELVPPLLYELGLEPAVQSYCESFGERYRIDVEFSYDGSPIPFEEHQLSLFKAIRELMVNVIKHSKATRIKVSLGTEDSMIRALIEDNGTGFTKGDTSQPQAMGFGLFNIKERLHHAGGTVVIDSIPGHGTFVTLKLPLTGNTQETGAR